MIYTLHGTAYIYNIYIEREIPETGDVSEEDAKVGFLLHEGLMEHLGCHAGGGLHHKSSWHFFQRLEIS
jgi:hypothetical protein